MRHSAAIFDLDGVLADTAKYHYLAWKRLALELGFDFTERDNERFKGVSRERCMDILAELGGLRLDAETKRELADRKNGWYRGYLDTLDPSGLLPGARDYVAVLRARGIRTAVGSASRNAVSILQKTGIYDLFDAVVDGNAVAEAKPDPAVFLAAAKALGVPPASCVVFEDAHDGVRAAKAAGMTAVGIGDPETLREADAVFSGLAAADDSFFI